jgi:tellurite resistance protein
VPPSPDLQPLDDDSDVPCVPMVGRLTLESLLKELTQALQDCRQLYLSCVPQHSGFLDDIVRQLADSQERLHQGLLRKICATIAQADGRWAYEEQRCAEAVFRHLGLPCAPQQLRESADDLTRQAAKLTWRSLIRPFLEFLDLRGRRAELETVVVRIANLIAKADGSVSPRETVALRHIVQAVRSDRRIVVTTCSAPLTTWPPPVAAVGAETRRPGALAAGSPGQSQSPPAASSPALLQVSLQRLDEMVGLRQIKQEIREFADVAALQNQRRLAGLPYDAPTLQWVFLGPPGVGKVTVAQILASVFVATGMLQHNRLVSLDPLFELTDTPAGKVQQILARKLAQAVGGTLLVDHAGALFAADGAGSAAPWLLEALAPYRGQIALVLADQVERLQSAVDQHPELRPPVARQLHFPDCTAGQLGQIFQRFCERARYRVTRAAQVKLLLGFQWRLEQDGPRCGNGHLVRQAFEAAVHRLARRLSGAAPLTPELLTTLEPGDIAIQGVPATVWRNLADPRRTFLVRCPDCERETLVGPNFLGLRVECKNCRHRFVCAWVEPCGR